MSIVSLQNYTNGITTTDSNGTEYQWPDVGTDYRWRIKAEDWNAIYGHHEDNPKKERRAGMETLYTIYVVSKDREIVMMDHIVAENEDEAKLEIDIHSVLRAKNL